MFIVSGSQLELGPAKSQRTLSKSEKEHQTWKTALWKTPFIPRLLLPYLSILTELLHLGLTANIFGNHTLLAVFTGSVQPIRISRRLPEKVQDYIVMADFPFEGHVWKHIIGPCWVMNRNGDTNLCTCCQPSAKTVMQSWSQSKPQRQRWTNCPVILCVCCDLSGCTLIPLLSTCLQRWPDAPDHLQAWQLFSSPDPTSKPFPPTVLSYDCLFSSPLLHIPHNHDQPDRHDYQNFLQQNVKIPI